MRLLAYRRSFFRHEGATDMTCCCVKTEVTVAIAKTKPLSEVAGGDLFEINGKQYMRVADAVEEVQINNADGYTYHYAIDPATGLIVTLPPDLPVVCHEIVEPAQSGRGG
jgi:hypothetical protein